MVIYQNGSNDYDKISLIFEVLDLIKRATEQQCYKLSALASEEVCSVGLVAKQHIAG
jgi:hypothetical protein